MLPSTTNTHGLASLSRVSWEPILARRALKKEQKEFHSFLKSMHLRDGTPQRAAKTTISFLSVGTITPTVVATKGHRGAWHLHHILEPLNHLRVTLLSPSSSRRTN